MNICVIPARGGSKRLPRKNIKEFMGRPIIDYSMDVALELKEKGKISQIIVSSDDAEILHHAWMYNANIIPMSRNPENATDDAGLYDVMKEVYIMRSIVTKEKIESILCLYPCAPLVKVDNIIKSMGEGMIYEFETISAYKNKDGVIRESGDFFWTPPKLLFNNTEDVLKLADKPSADFIKESDGSVKCSKYIYYMMPIEEIQDINVYPDWIEAEEKYKVMHGIKV